MDTLVSLSEQPLSEQGERDKDGYSGASFGTAKRGKTHPFVPSKRPGDKRGQNFHVLKQERGQNVPGCFFRYSGRTGENLNTLRGQRGQKGDKIQNFVPRPLSPDITGRRENTLTR